ncbi:DUF4157 domain-containing protein [Methanosarcina sp. Z-7115]|uniref:DUF4157 domain-containing protein n=1 Tax=Methanosarcina baikalica TaxID=3073890 RepID=A0ABU2D0H4_9EURY|nr:DUF4157 domain-containing protein [Methanosarcina sp. Z-7115]MDR7665494.1 DUF4157 domain-containing protein [Methanosarcina sp. Z-7115]
MAEHQQAQQSKKPDTNFQKQAIPLSHTPASNTYSIIQRAKINPRSLTHADIMQLQRTIGNRAVGMLLSSLGNTSTAQQATVQRQEIPEEEEPLQGKFESVQRQEIPEEEEPLQGKMAETVQRQEIPEEEEPLQGKFESKPEISSPSFFAAPITQRQELEEEEKTLQGKMIGAVQRQEIPEEEEPLQAKTENNTGMPDNLKAGVETLSGIDMSDVKVHYNSDGPANVGALAYTQGTDIHIAPGQEKHLPHETWHVVQQKESRVRPTIQLKDVAVNDDVKLEHEADEFGKSVTQMMTCKKATVAGSSETTQLSQIVPMDFQLGGGVFSKGSSASTAVKAVEVGASKKKLGAKEDTPNCYLCVLADYLDKGLETFDSSLGHMRISIQIFQDTMLKKLGINVEMLGFENYTDFFNHINKCKNGEYFIGWKTHIIRGTKVAGQIMELWDPQNQTGYSFPMKEDLYFSLRIK